MVDPSAPPVNTADQVQQILTSVADLTTELADTRARLLKAKTDLLQAQAQAMLRHNKPQQPN
jgi:ABC-type transporter Mla subunit MlaD